MEHGEFQFGFPESALSAKRKNIYARAWNSNQRQADRAAWRFIKIPAILIACAQLDTPRKIRARVQKAAQERRYRYERRIAADGWDYGKLRPISILIARWKNFQKKIQQSRDDLKARQRYRGLWKHIRIV